MTGTVEDRFWSKVNKHGPRGRRGRCWLWTAGQRKGYGAFLIGDRKRQAHVVAYELEVGPVPEGLMLDHTCRRTLCVRPSHLEPVTNRENLLRGRTLAAANAAKRRCPKGHRYDERNTYRDASGRRHCRRCTVAASRRYRRRLRRRQAARRGVAA